MSIFIGETVNIAAEVKLLNVLSDPDTLTVTIDDPIGPPVTYTYGVDPEVVRTSVGKYRIDQVVNVSGAWGFAWNATWTSTNPTATALISGAFFVESLLYTLVIHAGTLLPANIAGAQVTIFYLNGVIAASGVTDASGDFPLQFPLGDYRLEVRKTGFGFPITSNFSFVAPATVNVIGTDFGITQATDVPRCLLYGYLKSVSGEVDRELEIYVDGVGSGNTAFTNASSTPSGVDKRSIGVSDRRLVLLPNDDGYWEVLLVIGATVRVYIPSISFDKTFRIPSQESLNLKDVLPDPGQFSPGIATTASGSFNP
jgi:hypothetical protein